MIFQDPLSTLHPYYTVGAQIAEAYLVHNDVGKRSARKHAVDMLGRVGIPQPASRIDDYPHQFSGGMRQRAMIAMALSCDPELLIADEPTTALDVTVQAQILDLIWRPAAANTTPRSSSSLMTWVWWPSWPTTRWSCTPAGSGVRQGPGVSTSPATLTPGPARLHAASTRRAWNGSCRSRALRQALLIRAAPGCRSIPGAVTPA